MIRPSSPPGRTGGRPVTQVNLTDTLRVMLAKEIDPMEADLAQVLDRDLRHELILIAALHAEVRHLPTSVPPVPRDTADD